MGAAVWLLWPASTAPHEPVRVLAAASSAATASAPARSQPAQAAAGPAPAATTAVAVAAGASAGPSSDDLADHVPAGQVPTMKQVIEGLHARGIRTGLGAFNPPGTRPPLIGLAVPEDFPLPPGYVRHHQATDDGQRIEAILMFAPDFRLFDAQGREIPLPADRVVPPEWAPPGLPLRRITLPAPRQPE